MQPRRFVLALAAAGVVGACGPTDDGVLEPEVGRVEQAYTSPAQAERVKLADIELNGLLLGNAAVPKAPLGATDAVPDLILGIAKSFGVVFKSACTQVETSGDADDDGVPQALTVRFNCLDQRLGGAYKSLTGVIRLSDPDDEVAGTGYNLTFNELKAFEHASLAENHTRVLNGTAKIVIIKATPMFAIGWVGITSDLAWRFADQHLLMLQQVEYSSHNHGVYTRDKAVVLPMPSGTFQLWGSAAISWNGGKWSIFSYEADPALRYSRRCEVVHPQGPGFYAGAVEYSGGGAPLKIEFTGCNEWQVDEGGPI